MIILCAVGLGAVGSLAFGRWLALRQVPDYIDRKWNDHARQWPTLTTGANGRHYMEQIRGDAVGFVWLMVFFWWVMLPVSLAVRSTRVAVDRRDPFLQREQIEQQRKRIAELERELGMR